MIKRLRLYFILINMSIVTIMLCVIFGVVLYSTQDGLERQSLHMMQSFSDERTPRERPEMKPEGMRQPVLMLQLDPDGALVVPEGEEYAEENKEYLEQLARLASSTEQPTGVLPEHDLRFLRAQGPHGQKLLFADITLERSAMETLLRNSLLVGAASFFLFLLISIFLSRWVVRPVERAWEQQRRFVADASHELKTPLTVITTNAEMLGDPACTPGRAAEYAGNILTMARQMRMLTYSLLDLARVDNGAARANMERCDLSALVAQALLPFEPVFFEKGLELSSQIEPSLLIHASSSHLNQTVEILLDNAQKYSDAQGEVRVTLQRRGRYALLRVANPGPAIEPQELKNVFKRFYRSSEARTRDGSYGLGLSIAQSIVQEHRGRIWAESADGINTFSVLLPLCKRSREQHAASQRGAGQE
ncbi:MAG: HAMP domain-containing sensor histidine kinase [Eubacteriales bacterium]|nr:HAMP domain-containing sensor histidine kinase [Eubacteriales bacterium]